MNPTTPISIEVLVMVGGFMITGFAQGLIFAKFFGKMGEWVGGVNKVVESLDRRVHRIENIQDRRLERPDV